MTREIVSTSKQDWTTPQPLFNVLHAEFGFTKIKRVSRTHAFQLTEHCLCVFTGECALIESSLGNSVAGVENGVADQRADDSNYTQRHLAPPPAPPPGIREGPRIFLRKGL